MAVVTCRFCGSANLLGAPHCHSCGKELRPAAPSPPAARASAPTTLEHWLVAESGPLAGKRFPITDRGVRVGRHPSQNQIVLNDDEVSRLHARIFLDAEGKVQLEDTSANGTYVNNRRVEQATLQSGDHIRFAFNRANLFVYRPHQPGAPPPPMPPPPVKPAEPRHTEPWQGEPRPRDQRTFVLPPEVPLPYARLQLVLDRYAVKDIPLEAPRVELGHSAGAGKVVIDHPSVSTAHAELLATTEARRKLRDLGSTNGTFVNGERIHEERLLQEGDLIQLGACDTHLLLYRESRPRALALRDIELNRPVVTLGRDRSNHIHLDHPTVSQFHAEIHKRDATFELVDKDSTNGTFVNGVRIRRHRLQPRDRITLGAIQLSFDGKQFEAQSDEGGVRVSAYGLRRVVPDLHTGKSRMLLDNVSLAIEPCEFIGVLGPSGAGKSTLMDALNGLRPADRGRVLLNNWNLYRDYVALRSLIGHVPQEDILHRALSARECLYYAARLRLPDDYGAKEIWERVFAVMKSLDLAKRADSPIQQLSGGERKRVSLGIELLSKPSLLFLDEPTAGQDPRREMEMMRLFREIAGRGSTVVITTHLLGSFSLLDKVAVLVGGQLAYFGPSQEMLPYFRTTKPQEVYDRLQDKTKTPKDWAKEFFRSELYRDYVAHPLGLESPAHAQPGSAQARAEEKRPEPARPQPRRARPSAPIPGGGQSGLRQLNTLLSRLLTLKVKDWKNVAGLLLPPAVIAILSGLMKWNNPNDPQTLFITVIAALWFGCSASVREIVDEQVIYRRERQHNLTIPSYLGSKLIYLVGLAALQTGLFVVLLTLMGAQKNHFLGAWGMMWVMTLHGALIGLLISAVSSTPEKALYIFPLTLIPQLLFAGLLVPVEKPTPSDPRPVMNKPLRYVSSLAVARWGLEALADLYL
ncbi:MAG: FHA domain-containing protein, partial [Terriglobia bacterium]